MKICCRLLGSILFFSLSFAAIDGVPLGTNAADSPLLDFATNRAAEVIPEEALEPINGWQIFQLGQDYETVARGLQENYKWLVPKRELFPDIVDPADPESIDIHPNDYFERLSFQFSEITENNPTKTLYLIRMRLHTKQFGYLKIYDQLKAKYGPPQEVSFRGATWIQGDRKLILERETVVKYFSRDRFPVQDESVSTQLNQRREEAVQAILEGM